MIIYILLMLYVFWLNVLLKFSSFFTCSKSPDLEHIHKSSICLYALRSWSFVMRKNTIFVIPQLDWGIYYKMIIYSSSLVSLVPNVFIWNTYLKLNFFVLITKIEFVTRFELWSEITLFIICHCHWLLSLYIPNIVCAFLTSLNNRANWS